MCMNLSSFFRQNRWLQALAVILVLIVVNLLAQITILRFDLTNEKRFSISDNTKTMARQLDKDVIVNVYLDGDLNPSFLRLKKATQQMLDEIGIYARRQWTIHFIDPSQADSDKQRQQNYESLTARGLKPTVVYEKDNQGKSIQKLIFPWAEIIYDGDTVPVRLLENNPTISGPENLNHSIENLEFAFADPLRVKAQKSVEKIAFIEGHGELAPEQVYDASVALSKYFQVDRGALSLDPNILSPYKAIIIAGPKLPFSETDKYIIDQYIMRGGKVLFLIDGVRFATDSLSTAGMTPAIPLDVNLSDMLFKYGCRIVPALLQDMQCVQVPVNVAPKGESPNWQPMPFYFSPLLLASPESPVTRNIVQVRANMTSGIDLNVNSNSDIHKTVLLVTSNASHAISTPARIDLNSIYDIEPETYFTQHYLPVAAAFEGSFPSLFANRMTPEGIYPPSSTIVSGKRSRIIVAACSEIIRNDIAGNATNPQVLPLGYDRYANREYGNRDFILNSVLFLTDDNGWLQLRSRQFKLRMLNKTETIKHRLAFQILNVALPALLLLGFAFAFFLLRRRRYARS